MKRRTLISLGLSSFALAAARAAAARSPLPSSNLQLRFAAIGDVGTGKSGQFEVADAMAQRWQSASFPLVLMTGDNIYPDGDISKVKDVFERPYKELLEKDVKFYASLGNHDFQTKRGQSQIDYPGYNMNGRYYSFSEQSVQFFALDTNLAHIGDERGELLWQSQLRWLRAALMRSQFPWKVVFAHHTIYSSGQHGTDAKLIADLSPILERHGVQLYINGHDHNYERTQPINGITYITSGNGAKLRPVGSSDWTARTGSQLGFTTFDMYSDRIALKAVDVENQTYDEAIIQA